MRKYFVIIIFTHAVFVSALSQNIDSLKKILPSLHDSARVDCLNELSEIYIGSPSWWFSPAQSKIKLDTGEIFALQALEEAKKINYTYGMAKATSLKAELAFEKYYDFSETEKFGREAIFLYKKTTNKKGLNRTYWRLGTALHAQSKFPGAISNYDTGYNLSEKAGDSNYVFASMITLATVYMESGDYKKAFEKMLDLHQLILKNNAVRWKSSEFGLLGDLTWEIEDPATALKYYQQASQLTKNKNDEALTDFAWLFAINKQFDSAKYYYSLVDTGNQRSLPYYLKSIAGYYFLQKQYDKALPNLLRSLNYDIQENDVNQMMQALADIANTYLALQDYDSAFKYAHEALAMQQQTGARDRRESYEILYSVYDHWHRADSALFYHKKYMDIKDSINSAQLPGKLAAYGFEQKIELLNKEKEINQQQLKIQNIQLQKQSLLKNIFIGGIIILFVLAAIIFRIIMLKRRNEAHRRELAENELKIQRLESQKQLSELEMQALRAQMNPHFIFNCLSSINLFILKNETEAASDYLIKFSRLMRMVLNNSQKPLIALEDELDMLGLYLDMERLRFKNTFDYSITFNESIDLSNVFIPPLLLQPFAENAIWHGLMHKQGLGHLEISLSAEEKLLTCIIADDGIGRTKAAAFKTKSAEKQKSMGLQITKDRLAFLNQNTYKHGFLIEDIIDDEGNDAGTRVILKMHYQDMSEACT